MGKKWKIKLSKPAVKYLMKLPFPEQNKIRLKLDYLQGNQRDLLDIKKLVPSSLGKRRIRIGKWRIIYEIYEDTLLILVLDINTRGDIYK